MDNKTVKKQNPNEWIFCSLELAVCGQNQLFIPFLLNTSAVQNKWCACEQTLDMHAIDGLNT